MDIPDTWGVRNSSPFKKTEGNKKVDKEKYYEITHKRTYKSEFKQKTFYWVDLFNKLGEKVNELDKISYDKWVEYRKEKKLKKVKRKKPKEFLEKGEIIIY